MFCKCIEVDEEIASLLQLLWKNGYVTWNSCQNNTNDCIWIQFSQNSFNTLYRNAALYHYHICLNGPPKEPIVNDSDGEDDNEYDDDIDCTSDSCLVCYIDQECQCAHNVPCISDWGKKMFSCNGGANTCFEMLHCVSIRFPRKDLDLFTELIEKTDSS